MEILNKEDIKVAEETNKVEETKVVQETKPAVEATNVEFKELGLTKVVLDALEAKGYVHATPIQAKAIPLVLQGKDVIGQAQTGTGKTAAFGLPLIDKVELENKNVQHIIVSPTRELASQISKELTSFSKIKGVKVTEIFGGVSYTRQQDQLKRNPQVVVATPGRLIDLIKRNKIKVKGLKSITLDEADEMLAIGFLKEIEEIISFIPEDSQRLMFTATMDKKVKKVAEKFCKNAIDVSVSSGLASTKNIEQQYMIMKEKSKFVNLVNTLNLLTVDQIVIFGKTKRRVDGLSIALNKCGFSVAGLQGDMSQRERTNTMNRFKAGEVKILVATDVAARGIDVKNVELVVNFDLPEQVEYYTHRIGRTGRAGKKGTSISFVRPEEEDYMKHIASTTKSNISKEHTPSEFEVKEKNKDKMISLLAKKVSESKMDKETAIVREIKEQFSHWELAQLLVEEHSVNKEVYLIKLEPESPIKYSNGKVIRKRRNGSRSGGGRSSRDGRSGGRSSRDGRSGGRSSRDGRSGGRSSRDGRSGGRSGNKGRRG